MMLGAGHWGHDGVQEDFLSPYLHAAYSLVGEGDTEQIVTH